MITLSSDFGSPYPAAMKGVLCTWCDARLIDVSHDFPRQDVRTAAFWLRELLPWFPPATHLVVVDPGVGTDRAALVVRAGEHALVGPDNGVLVPAARRLAAGDDSESQHDADESTGSEGSEIDAFEIGIEDPDSATFHGRDVFAPAAAAVHEVGPERAADLDDLSPAEAIEDLRFPTPDIDAEEGKKRIEGTVLVVDGFGNAITNVPGRVLEGRFGETAVIDGESVAIERSYAHVARGERLLTVGSHGNVELAANRGRGDAAFGVEADERITIEVA